MIKSTISPVSLVWTGVGRGLVPHVVDESESESPQQESSESTAQDDRATQGWAGLRVGESQDSGEDGDRVDVPEDDEVDDVLRAVVGVAGSGDSIAGTVMGEGSLSDSFSGSRSGLLTA